jgi:thioredoxin reductase (NADPH)
MEKIYDVLIVGAGPAGITAGIYAKRANLDILILEKEFIVGGLLNFTSDIENYPGFPKIKGFELSQKFEEHLKALNVPIKNGVEVQKVKKDGDIFIVETNQGIFKSKSLIYGAGWSFVKLGVEGEEKFRGRGVSYCAVCDAPFYKEKAVAVLGRGEIAVEEALYLTKFASKVYLLLLNKNLSLPPHLEKEFKEAKNLETFLGVKPLKIDGKLFVEKIMFEHENEIKELNVDGVFIFAGLKPNVEPIKDLVETTKAGFVITDENMQTKTPLLFAVGDIRDKHLRQIVTACSDGAIAAQAAYKLLKYGKI